jgi:tetratricopeptide (TPR) repeat protein
VLVAQGKRDEALKAYRDSLAIRERLAAADRSNSVWQRGLSVSYEKVGDVLVAQGKRDEALKAYRDSLAIRERLAAADRSNSGWQRDLSVSYTNIGDVLLAQGKLEEALKAYRDGLVITEQLAAADRSNTEWQHDLSVSYIKVGDVLVDRGDLPEALKSYRDALAIRGRLALADPTNADRQRDLALSYERVGDVLKAQGDLAGALKSYREDLTIIQRLVSIDGSNAQWRGDLEFVIGRIGGLAYRFLLARDFTSALAAADEAISLAPEEIWLYTNRAHALMFIGNTDEARAIYLKYRGVKNVQNEKSWEMMILEDFADLRKKDLTNPLMDEIEKLFTSAGWGLFLSFPTACASLTALGDLAGAPRKRCRRQSRLRSLQLAANSLRRTSSQIGTLRTFQSGRAMSDLGARPDFA